MAIKVKLRDKSSIFRDASQGITLTGSKVVEVKRTPTIVESINGGALILVEESKKDEKVDNQDNDTQDQDSDDSSNDQDQDQDNQDSDDLDNSDDTDEDSELSLTDLREKYPNINARNRRGFLKKLKEEKGQ